MADKQPNSIDQIMALKKNYLAAFNSEGGKKVLADLEKQSYQNETTFHRKDTALDLAYKEGRRLIVLLIKKKMNLDVRELKELMEREAESEG